MEKTPDFEWVISPETSWRNFRIREIIAYKDLLFSLVRKELISSYQQTILGPAWILFQPLLTVFTFILVFNKMIGISTQGVPSFLYYLAGITLWNLFSELFLKVSYCFAENANIFNKVYFPRLITPLSVLLVYLLRFCIQFSFLMIVLVYYWIEGSVAFSFSNVLLVIPVIICISCIGVGAGLIFSIITVRYRDLLNLLQLLVRLLLFVCPVFYSVAVIPERFKWLANLNPLTAQFEMLRFSLFSTGDLTIYPFLYSICFSLAILLCGLALFNKMNERLIDIV